MSIFLKVSVAGSHRVLLKALPLNCFTLLPEPAISSTFPVCSRIAWMELSWYFSGSEASVQWPYFALYSGWLIS